MRTTFVSLVAGAAFLVAVAAVPALAHHSFAAEFDAKKPVKLQGTVTKMEWINPHSWIHIDVKAADGKVTSWMIEGGSPNALLAASRQVRCSPLRRRFVIAVSRPSWKGRT